MIKILNSLTSLQVSDVAYQEETIETLLINKGKKGMFIPWLQAGQIAHCLTPYLNHLLTITIFATLKAELALISI